MQSEAALKRTQFDVAVAAADAYLTLAAAQETVRAAQAGVDRARSRFSGPSQRSVNAELRPGADASRAEAELAAARTQLIQAQQATDVARATLAQFVGSEPAQIDIAAPGLLQLPPERACRRSRHRRPILSRVEQNAVVEQAQAQLRALERSYFPRFYLQGAAYARGTGAETRRQNPRRLERAGAQCSELRARLHRQLPDHGSARDPGAAKPRNRPPSAPQTARCSTDRHRPARAMESSRSPCSRARAGSRPIRPYKYRPRARPLQQATARYQSGLGNIDEVAEAQRLLTQAEIDDALARLGVWRGLLGVATAAGDIQPFIAEASQ